MKRLFAFIVLFVIGLSAMAQNSTQGREFWFSFMKNGYDANGNEWVNLQVMISAKRACSGIVSNPRTPWSRTFTVDDEGVVNLQIPESVGYDPDNGAPSDFGLLLVATDTVSVYTANCATNSFDASFVLPTESLGSEYILQCDNQSRTQSVFAFPRMETSAFLVVATEDNTEVDIIPSVTTLDGHQAGVAYRITLDRGQSYAMRSNNNTRYRDLSGTLVSARDNKRIAVFNGNTLTAIPNSCGGGHDHIFEQALPVSTWGRQFAITSSRGRTRDKVKITASTNNDTIWCNGQRLAVVDAGQSHEFWIYSGTMGANHISGGSCFVETSQPSMVYLYNTTSDDPEAQSHEDGDPSMVWIPPIEQKIDEITFCTFNHLNATIDSHYVNIVVETSSVNGVYLDGNQLAANLFGTVRGNDNLSYAKIMITHDTHTLSCARGLVAHVYGFGDVKGYAYCVGSNVQNLNGTLYVNGQLGSSYHNGLFLCVGESADFEVLTNYPIQQVVWDFDGTMETGGASVTHAYQHTGAFVTKACIEGIDPYTSQPIYDTMTVDVKVGEPEYHEITHSLCDESTYCLNGVEYTQSGYYEILGTNIYGCDSSYYLTLSMDYTPEFEIIGNHWPIGGSETYISVNEYAIRLNNEGSSIDTIIWQVDCENWRVEPHGIGESCSLYIFSFLEDEVLLHATVINGCDTVAKSFFIKTSYFDIEENGEELGFDIAPNPTDGNITLHFGDWQGLFEVRVFTTLGQMVDAFTMEANRGGEQTYSLPDVPDGLYYLVLKNNGRIGTRKVLLNRQ